MATTVNKILDLARAQIGTTEQPAGSNKVKYNTAYYGSEVSGAAYPWCCAFIWWLFHELNAGALYYGGGKTASCTTLMRYYKQQNQFYTKNPRPGDLVFFNFDSNVTDAEHIGIVEAVNGNIIITIEGNTSGASNDNGGIVMRRERRANVILGFARPAYEEKRAGWIEDKGRWWYRHTDGSYTKDDWEQIDGAWYYFDGNGWMQTGWIQPDGNYYYLKSSGAMAVNEVVTIDSPLYGPEVYAFGPDGRMLKADPASDRGRLI